MVPLSGSNADDTGAVADRFYDAAGNFTTASISFGPKFGTSPPDANEPLNLRMYPRAFDVERTVLFSRKRYRVYSFGHEFGHILSGFDPTTSADAQVFSTLSPRLLRSGSRSSPFSTSSARSDSHRRSRPLSRNCSFSNSS